MPIELKMPALSPTMEEGTLAKWLVKEGDEVSSGDILAEIETDKATMEFEAVDEGKIAKILVPEGTDGVKVGAPIAILAAEGEDVKAAASAAPKTEAKPEPKAEAKPEPKAEQPKADETPKAAPQPTKAGERIKASPLARRIAEDMQRRLAALPPREGAAPVALYMTPGGVTSGEGTLVHEILRAAGLANFQDRPGWNALPLERLAYERPDVIAAAFYESAGGSTDSWSAARHPVARAQLSDGPVVPLDGAWTSCGGWFLVDAIEALAQAGEAS